MAGVIIVICLLSFVAGFILNEVIRNKKDEQGKIEFKKR